MNASMVLCSGTCGRMPGVMAVHKRMAACCRAGWLLPAVLLAAAPLAAAEKTWTGGGADHTWSTAANWGGGAPVDNAD